MERTLFTLVALLTAALGFATWMRPTAVSELSELIGVKTAQAQSPYPSTDQSPYPSTSQPPYAGPGTYPANPGSFAPPVGTTQPAATPPYAAVAPVNSGPPADAKSFESAQVLATIGTEVILAGDVMPLVNDALAQKAGQIPAGQMEAARQALLKQAVNQMIETKLVYSDAKHTIPAENFPKVEEKLAEDFEKNQVKKMIATLKVTTRTEVDAALREGGTSLVAQKRAYMERTLATQWLRNQIKPDEDIRPDETLSYYQQHPTEFEITAKVRWEELMVRFDRYPSREDAARELEQMGNDVLRGVPFAEVAKVRSQGPTAPDGGAYDWTTQGSLASDEIDQAVFGLPVGRMSQIIESERGLHIVRVVERKDAGRTSFTDAQVEIRKKIKQERIAKQIKDYLGKLRERTPVRTVFEDPPAEQQIGALPGGAPPR